MAGGRGGCTAGSQGRKNYEEKPPNKTILCHKSVCISIHVHIYEHIHTHAHTQFWGCVLVKFTHQGPELCAGSPSALAEAQGRNRTQHVCAVIPARAHPLPRFPIQWETPNPSNPRSSPGWLLQEEGRRNERQASRSLFPCRAITYMARYSSKRPLSWMWYIRSPPLRNSITKNR